MHQVLTIFMTFAGLSLLAFGGGNVVLPQVEKDVVSRHHWISSIDFAHLYALGQLAPGPSAMYMSGIGFIVAGVPGALAAGVGFIFPSTVLMIVINSLEHVDRWRNSPWRHAMSVGMAPAAIGLLAAGAFRLARIESTVTGNASNFQTQSKPVRFAVVRRVSVSVTGVERCATGLRCCGH